MTPDEAIHRAVCAVQIRQRPSGAWEFYGPRAAEAGAVAANRKALLKVRARLVLELLGVPPQSGTWYWGKQAINDLVQKVKPLPSLDQVVGDLIEQLEARGVFLGEPHHPTAEVEQSQ